MIKHALDNGIDTANGYSKGTSEEYLGQALKKNIARNKVVIASKVYFNPGRLSKEAIHRESDGTLKRLGTDYLDLYIIHRCDYNTPMAETMENHYNLFYREDERELIPICQEQQVSLMPYIPLAAGYLSHLGWRTDTLRSKTDRVAMGKYDSTEAQDYKIVQRVSEVAQK